MSDHNVVVDRVLLSQTAADTIYREARRSSDGTETGGILLGHLDATGTAYVHVAGDPGPVAVRTPTFFLRDLHHAQRLADQAFTDHGSVWIGDWHTHLHAPAVPSHRDLATYAGLLTDTDLNFTTFISIIAVAADPRWRRQTPTAWACYPERAETIPLALAARP